MEKFIPVDLKMVSLLEMVSGHMLMAEHLMEHG
jgi:hypothetical protein